uniref:Uncharacterized protein n=1 Tax=Cucumis melo TaxID=3656 RepID=A0A9I9E2T3_CUCME
METVPENSIPWLSDSIAKIREDGKSGVENLTEECVSTMADVTRLLMKIGGTEFRMRYTEYYFDYSFILISVFSRLWRLTLEISLTLFSHGSTEVS